MTDPHAAAVPAAGHEAHEGPNFEAYMRTFYALMVLTVASYLAFLVLGHGMLPMIVILALATLKASLVVLVFMHLYFDIGKVYGFIIPVVILCIMSTFIFLVDQVVVWHHQDAPDQATMIQAAPRH
jgi:caa(3)-type oxidase subunit IV